MINAVWIIHKDGKCLFHREYKDLNINEQLFSGFLVAILSFSKEISNQDLKSIILEELVLYYKNIEEKRLIFVVAADRKDRESKIMAKINLIETAFFSEFDDELRNWNGNITTFQKFNTTVDKLLNNQGFQIELFDSHFFNKTSIDYLIKKVSSLFGKKKMEFFRKKKKGFFGKKKKEIEKLVHTIGILDNLLHEREKFQPPKFLLEAHQKLKKTLRRWFRKGNKKMKD